MANRRFDVFNADLRDPALWRALVTEELAWTHTPRFGWECRLLAADLTGLRASQTITITIPTSGFVTGRLVVAFSGGGLGATVNITADAPVGDTEDDLGDTLTAAIDTAIGTTLAGVVASVTNTAANVVVVVCEPGIGLVSAVPTFTPAQQTTVTWGGTLVDGPYSINISCDDPNADEDIANNRVAGTPANANAMAAAFEAAAEALIAGNLAGVLVSADDAGAVNTLIFEPGVEADVTATVTPNTTHTFGGTATDGDYVTRFDSDALPGGSLTVTTTRAGGSPATHTDLADAFEASVESGGAHYPLLSALLSNADNAAGANILSFYDGVTGVNVVAVSAPTPGTLVVADPTVVVADATPAGPTVTVAHAVVLDLNSIAFDQGIPANIIRSWCFVHVIEAFGAGRTLTVGDENEPAGIIGSTPLDLNTEGRSCSSASDAEYQPRPELAFTPTATIALGSSATVTAGEVLIEVLFTPNLANVAAA